MMLPHFHGVVTHVQNWLWVDKFILTYPRQKKSWLHNGPNLADFQARNQEFKQRQKQDFDCWHRAWELPDLPDDTEVFVTTGR